MQKGAIYSFPERSCISAASHRAHGPGPVAAWQVKGGFCWSVEAVRASVCLSVTLLHTSEGQGRAFFLCALRMGCRFCLGMSKEENSGEWHMSLGLIPNAGFLAMMRFFVFISSPYFKGGLKEGLKHVRIYSLSWHHNVAEGDEVCIPALCWLTVWWGAYLIRRVSL